MRSLVILGILAACGGCSNGAYDACLRKGEAYYREVDMWPKLFDGRDAAAAVADKCGRTTGAFGD